MNNVFESVNGHDLAFTAFVGAARDQDLIVFADGDGPDLAGGLARISRVGELGQKTVAGCERLGCYIHCVSLVVLCSGVRS